jgi:hypothetical protein
MRFISHRGNLNQTNRDLENRPSQIIKVIEMDYDCEIDLWCTDHQLFLGHDEPQYLIELDFLQLFVKNLWVHCKNIEALLWCKDSTIKGLNYFWHQEDKVTLTSLGFIWAYPGFQPIRNSIAVMPEINEEHDILSCVGICSDRIELYRKEYGKV